VVKVSPFHDYKALLLSSMDDRQSLELLMKQLDSGEKFSSYFTDYWMI